MKIIHIQNTEKFIEPYINFVNKNFEENEHQFTVIIGNKDNKFESKHKNINYVYGRSISMLKILKSMSKADKIILHGLFNNNVVILLFLHPWLLKKCYWTIWGGDLYNYQYKKRTIKTKLIEFVRSVVIRNIGGIITHIKGDYELAKEWYKVKGEYYYSFLYPSNLYKEFELSKENNYGEMKYIQVGNSANPSNNHMEIFDELLLYSNKNFKVICPLSYGDSNYAEIVIKQGKKKFGENFIPLTNFMPINEYLNILAKIDVALFNHKRQQAVGNITTLLSLGKKVYIRDDITTWNFCEEHGLKVYSINNELQDLFKPMPEGLKNRNIERVKAQFSETKLIEDWEYIFSSIV